MTYIVGTTAEKFIETLDDESVDAIITDPPYFGIVKDSWDNQWKTVDEFSDWLSNIFIAAKPKLKPTGSLIFFLVSASMACIRCFDV